MIEFLKIKRRAAQTYLIYAISLAASAVSGYANANFDQPSYDPNLDANVWAPFAMASWSPYDWSSVELFGTTFQETHSFGPRGEPPMVKVFKYFSGPEHRYCIVSWRPTLYYPSEDLEQVFGAIVGEYSAHYGTLDYVPSWWVRVDAYYKGILNQYKDVVANAVKGFDCRLVVSTGWSMGGAMAQLFAHWVWHTQSLSEIPLYSVASFNPGPVGNSFFRKSYEDKRNAISALSDVFCREGDIVRWASYLYGDSLDSAWELGCTHVGDKIPSGVAIAGHDGVPPNHDIGFWRNCGVLYSSDRQCPNSPGQRYSHSTSTHTSHGGGFVWSNAGQVSDMNCTQIREASDPHTWHDNYFCSWEDIDMEWSWDGPISGMHCTHINEPADPHAWHDNYLCVPDEGTPPKFSWSSAGPINSLDCIQWREPSDPHTWGDNWLCWTRD